MIKNSFLAFICFLGVLSGYSQVNIADDSSNQIVSKGALIAKIEVANLINPVDPTLLLALEYQFHDKMSLSQELGVITGFRGETNLLDDFIGFKLREEFRLYFNKSVLPDELFSYLSVSGGYRFMNLQRTGNVGIGCTGEDLWSCDYIRQLNEPVNSHRFDGTLKIGIIKSVLPKITLEGDVGLRFSYLNFQVEDEEDLVFFFDSNTNDQKEGFSVLPVVSIKIGYRL